jgi:hypothetical protein
MKRIFIPFVLITVSLNAQIFQEVQTDISNYGYASLSVGDFDADGFQDLLICGDDFLSNTQCDIYKNNNGVFQFYQGLQQGTYLGDLRFVNLRNDNTLDIVMTGQNRENITAYKTHQFKFNGSNYELDNTSNIGKIYASLGEGDLDHDGKLDLFLNGADNAAHGEQGRTVLDLYKNEGAKLTSSELVGGSQNGDFVIADFNNDGLLDVAIFGLNGENETETDYGAFFKVYTNQNGNLVQSQELYGMLYGSMVSADFNADGFQDLVVTGIGKSVEDAPTTLYLENDGAGNFITHDLLQGVQNFSSVKSIDKGDINNDGYYDFVMVGEDETGSPSSKVFLYDPSTDTFNLNENSGLANYVISASLRLFDYDNDNNLDLILVSADENYDPKTSLYRNLTTVKNEAPNAPTIFDTQVSDDKITFSWDGASDDKTPNNALQYELSVGSASGKADIAKYVVTTKNWFLNKENMPSTFYWSVKAIDASAVHSLSSEEQVYSSLSTNDVTKKNISIYPNPTSDVVNIKANQSVVKVNVYNLAGQQVFSRADASQINIQSLNKGVYLVEVILKDGQKIQTKLIKK